MEYIHPDIKRIEFLLRLQREIDEIELKDKKKAAEFKKKFYELVRYKFDADDPETSPAEKSDEPLHKPKEVHSFLEEINGNPSTKFFTHNWDNENGRTFAYKDYLGNAEIEFKKIKEKYPNVPRTLIAKLGAFYFMKSFTLTDDEKGKEKGWSEDHIKVGWSSKEVADWCNKNKEKSPYSEKGKGPKVECKLNNNDKLRYFKQVVDKFKAEIEFRQDLNNDLETLLSQKIELMQSRRKNDYIFDYKGIKKGIRLYTDIEKLIQAIRYMLRAIFKLETEHNKKIYFSFKEIEGTIKLEIFHEGSVFDKSIDAFDSKIKGGSGDTMVPAKKCLFSLCDWEMEAEFVGGKFGVYKILPELGFEERGTANIKGVKHILTFYRGG